MPPTHADQQENHFQNLIGFEELIQDDPGCMYRQMRHTTVSERAKRERKRRRTREVIGMISRHLSTNRSLT